MGFTGRGLGFFMGSQIAPIVSQHAKSHLGHTTTTLHDNTPENYHHPQLQQQKLTMFLAPAMMISMTRVGKEQGSWKAMTIPVISEIQSQFCGLKMLSQFFDLGNAVPISICSYYM